MKKTKKHFGPRLVTWLLTFCLVLGLLPAQAMAATRDDDPSTWPAPDSHYTADGRNPVYLMVDFTDEDKGGIAAGHYCDQGAELTPDIVKATATTSGYVKYTCSVCGSWAKINVPALTLSAFSLDPSYQGVVDNGVEFSGKPYTIVYDVVPAFRRFVGTELDNHVSVTSTGSYGIMITVDSAIYDNVELLTNERLVVYPKAIPWTAEFNSKVYDGNSLLDGKNVIYQDVNGSAVPAALSACDVKVVDGALTADTASPVANPVAAGPYAIGATITDTNYVWQTEKGKYNTVYTLTWIFPATNTIYVGDPITDVKLTTGNNLYSSPYNWTVDTGYAGFDSSKPGTTHVLTQVTKSSTSFGKVQIPVTVIARPILSVEEVVRSAPMGTPFNSLNLPATVTVTAEGGTGSAKTVSGVPVTWSDAGYDPYALTQSITGTLDVSGFPELSPENIPAFAATVNLTYGTVEAPTVNDYTKTYDGKATPLPMPSLPDGIKSVTISYNGSSNSGLPYSSSTPPTNAGTYTATVSYVMEQGYPQLSGVTVNYIISKAAQTCDAPTLASATTSSLTLNAVDNAEYSKDGQAWQDSPVFRNLDPGTTYTLYQRLKATDDGNYDASPAVSAQFSTEYTTVDPGDLNLQPQSYPYTGNPIAYQVPTIPHVTKITVTYTVGGQDTTTPPTNELPDTCFATLPGTGDLIILKRGETGYYRSDWNTSDADENRSIAEIHNQRRGITPAQVEAMQVGSMFGFHVPGSDPQIYYDNAVYARSSPLNAGTTISHPQKVAHAPVEGELLQYYVAKKECLYLEMQTMPELLLSKQSGIILLPDMICGRPLIPVSTMTQEKGRMEIVLEKGSISTEKEVNADYRIIAKVSVGPVEYALGQINARVPFFVTWERTPANDRKGKKPLTDAERVQLTAARDYLKDVMNGKTALPVKAWKAEYNKLAAQRKELNQRYLALKAEVKEAEQIRKSVYSILRQEQREQAPRRAQDMEH